MPSQIKLFKCFFVAFHVRTPKKNLVCHRTFKPHSPLDKSAGKTAGPAAGRCFDAFASTAIGFLVLSRFEASGWKRCCNTQKSNKHLTVAMPCLVYFTCKKIGRPLLGAHTIQRKRTIASYGRLAHLQGLRLCTRDYPQTSVALTRTRKIEHAHNHEYFFGTTMS